MRNRISNHCCGQIGSSTLRLTLAALLAREMGFRFRGMTRSKLKLLDDGEHRLTLWMEQAAQVCWVVCDNPLQLETALLRGSHRLPLNIKGSADPFVQTLKSWRAEARMRAEPRQP